MSSKSNSDQDVYQVMMLNQQEYAVPVRSIVSVLALEKILSLPNTPNWLTGVVHVRNAIVPVVNLTLLLEVDSKTEEFRHPLLVLLQHPQDPQRWLALCITDITRLINTEEWGETALATSTHHCIKNIVESDSQQLYLLDINKLFEQLMMDQG